MGQLDMAKGTRTLTLIAAAMAVAGLAIAWATPAEAGEVAVDLELVLAVDVSGSVDEVEGELQRQGYLAALRDPRVIRTIRAGPHRRIAVSYMEWAGVDYQVTIAKWAQIHDAKSAQAFANVIDRVPVFSGPWTSISTAIDHAAAMFEGNGYRGTRRVIDISGDGPNNRGRPVAAARDEAVGRGITINGLPIINDRVNPWGGPPFADLDIYYEEFVIGGPGAFIIRATSFKTFAAAILSKLIKEIAAAPAPPSAPGSRDQALASERLLK